PGLGARAEVPGAQHPVRLPPQGPLAPDSALLHARHGARRTLPVSVPARPGIVLRQGVLLSVHSRRSRRSDEELARRGLERRSLHRDAAAAPRTRYLSALSPLLQGRAVANARGRGGVQRIAATARDSGDGGALT